MDKSCCSIRVVKADSTHVDFLGLVRQLDEDLAGRYGELQKQYDKHNSVDYIKDIVVVYVDGVPAACGAFKQFSADTIEIKRVFVTMQYRRMGLARRVLKELEDAAAGKGYKYAVLETGIKQFEAISLYNSLGYSQIENYGPYVGNANSVCMRKELPR